MAIVIGTAGQAVANIDYNQNEMKRWKRLTKSNSGREVVDFQQFDCVMSLT